VARSTQLDEARENPRKKGRLGLQLKLVQAAAIAKAKNQ